jgi:hypothetical protein
LLAHNVHPDRNVFHQCADHFWRGRVHPASLLPESRIGLEI